MSLTIKDVAEQYGPISGNNKVFFAKEEGSDTYVFIKSANSYEAMAVNPMTGEHKVTRSDTLTYLPHARFYIAQDFDGMHIEDVSFESMINSDSQENIVDKVLGLAFFSYDREGVYVFVGYVDSGFRFAHIETGEIFTLHDIDKMFFYDAKIVIEPGEL